MSDDPVENVVERIDDETGDDEQREQRGDRAEAGHRHVEGDAGANPAGSAAGPGASLADDGDGSTVDSPTRDGRVGEAGDGAPGDGSTRAAIDDLTGPDRRLEPRVRYVWLLSSSAGAVVLGAIVGVAGAFLIDDGVRPGAAVFTVAFAVGAVMAFARYRRWRYRVREDSLFLDRGVLTQVRTVVPFVRIQHVDVSRGPLERAFGLATVVVYTAGSRGADVTVPGLTPERAEDLQRRLKRLTIVAEGEDAV